MLWPSSGSQTAEVHVDDTRRDYRSKKEPVLLKDVLVINKPAVRTDLRWKALPSSAALD